MPRKLHPLEIYRRGKPFGDPPETPPETKPVQRQQSSPTRSSRQRLTKWVGEIRSFATRRCQSFWARSQNWHLRKVFAGAVVLVLVVAGVYAVGFFPSSKSTHGGGSSPALKKSEWPDRTQPDVVGTQVLHCVEVVSGHLPQDETESRQAVNEWLEHRSRLAESVTMAGFGTLAENGGDLVVDARLYPGEDGRPIVALLIGAWPSADDPGLAAVLRWVRQNYPEACAKTIDAHDWQNK